LEEQLKLLKQPPAKKPDQKKVANKKDVVDLSTKHDEEF